MMMPLVVMVVVMSVPVVMSAAFAVSMVMLLMLMVMVVAMMVSVLMIVVVIVVVPAALAMLMVMPALRAYDLIEQLFFQSLAGFHCLQDLLSRELCDRSRDKRRFAVELAQQRHTFLHLLRLRLICPA